MNRILLLWLMCFCIGHIFSQKVDKKFTKEITKLLDYFKGNVGVYVHDLNSIKIVAINADSIFPTASMVNVPILVGIMNKIYKG